MSHYFRFSRFEIVLYIISTCPINRPSQLSPVPHIQKYSEDGHSADDREAQDDHTRGGEVLK